MTNQARSTNNDIHHRILALAALFGSEFSINWLQELSGDKPQRMLEALDLGLKKKWLASDKPGFYYFKDSQEQQKLQKSLTDKEQDELHLRIAKILQLETIEDPELEGILARSLLNIRNDIAGCRKLLAEGKAVLKQGREHEALLYYVKAIEDLGCLRGQEADWLLLEATIEYAKVSMVETDSSQAIRYISDALKRTDSEGFLPYRALLKMDLARHQWIRSEFASAMAHFEEGWELAKEIKDERLKRSANLSAAFFRFWQGRYNETLDLCEEIAPEIDQVPHAGFPLLQRPIPGNCLVFRGEVSQGLGMARSVIQVAQKLKNTLVACFAEFSMGNSHIEIGRFSEAIEFLESAQRKTEDGKHIYIRIGVLILLAYAYHKLGNNERAIAALVDFQELSRQSRMYFRYFPHKMHLCWAMAQGKLPHLEDFSLKEEIANALQNPNVYLKGLGYHYKALLAKKAGKPSPEVIENFHQALKWLDISGHQISIARIKLELAGEILEMGDEDKARSIGAPAIKFLSGINRDLIPKDLIHLERELRSNEELLKEIFQLGQQLVTIRDNKKLVGRIISTANRFTGAERGAIFLVDQGTDQVVLRGSINLTSAEIDSADFSESMKSIIKTARSGEIQKIDFDPGSKTEVPSGEFVRSCICVPMFLRNNAFGVLYHDHLDSTKGFGDTDLEVLNYFAAQAAIALDNAQAYQALEEMVKEQKEQKQYYKDQYLEDMGFENIVGRSGAIQQVFHHIESVAATDSTVLILGETGVGKELVARAIHGNSPRKSNAFVRVNCSAFTENLITSELFGHEKGAFTGAFERVIGRFELADGGTLFLDEIGDIPQEVQVRLLRVLQTREFERVGGHETLRSDFRLLVATNRDLEKEVQAGRFREDLFFRLNVFPIQVPPLRDRKSDIPLLAYHFLNVCAKKMGKRIERITKPDLEKLKAYQWPGNIRELENIIERGAILSSGAELIVPDIGTKSDDVNWDGAITTLEENERTHILRALRKTSGKVAGHGGAAEILGINPNTLRHRMKKLGIKKNERDTYLFAKL